MYIDELSHKLNASNLGCHINGHSFNNIVYADDMVLLATSPNSLQKLLDICSLYAEDHDIVYNVKKSKCMTIKPKLYRNIRVPLLFINGCSLDLVSTYTYLGVVMNDTFYDDDDISRQMCAIYSRGNSLIRKFKFANDTIKVQLFKTFICNFYCAALWSRYHISMYRRIVVSFKRIYRNMFQVRDGSITACMINTGCDPFEVILRKSVYGFRARLFNSDNRLVSVLCDSFYFLNSSVASKWNSMLF